MSLNGVWCGICAKYLAFGTYPRSAVGALIHLTSCIHILVFVYMSPFHSYYQITNVTFQLSIFFRKCNKMWVILQLVNVFVVE